MPETSSPNSSWKREAIAAAILLVTGLAVLPVAIWFVGATIFGDYGGAGFGGFYAALLRRLAAGSLVAWFLVLSPLLGVAALRLTFFAVRVTDSRLRQGKV